MLVKRLPLLLLPQVWVVDSYRNFHDTVFSVQSTAAGSMQLGLLSDTMVVIALGVLTLTANCLVAAVLLKKAAHLDARGYGSWSRTDLAPAERRSPARARSTRRRPQPRAATAGDGAPTPVRPGRPRWVEHRR